MAKKKLGKKAKRGKVQPKISDWAVEYIGEPDGMCPDGREVYDTIVKLEKKGKTPEQIIAFFLEKNVDAFQFVYDVIGFPEDARYDRGDSGDIQEAIDEIKLDLYDGSSLYSKEYVAAVQAFNAVAFAECQRLENLLEADPELVFKNGGFKYKFE